MGAANISIGYDSQPVLLGRDTQSGVPSFFFAGRIDEAAIYSRALGAGEITSIYDAGPAGRTTVGPYLTTSGQLPDAYLGQTYTHTYQSARGTASVTYSVAAGAMPSGLTLSSAGVLSGQPTNSGAFSFIVRATDGTGFFGEQLCLLRIYGPVYGPPGLVAWLRAENDAQDAAGTNHGTLSNGTTFATGKVGQAFSFDGVNDSVDIADAAALRPASLTFEAWVMFNSVNGTQVIVKKPGPSDNSYAMWIANGMLTADVDGGPLVGPTLSGPFSPVVGRWYHVACTFDNNTKRQVLYLDGTQIATGIEDIVIEYDAQPLLLGRGFGFGGSAADFISGRIDEAALYNRALSAFEINSIYNTGASGKLLPSTIERWKLANLGNANAPDLGDPEGDGLVTLLEYGLSTNPNAASTPPIVDIVTNPNGTRRLRLQLLRDPARNDLTLTIESSPDLQNWTTIATSGNGSPFSGTCRHHRRSGRDSAPIGDDHRSLCRPSGSRKTLPAGEGLPMSRRLAIWRRKTSRDQRSNRAQRDAGRGVKKATDAITTRRASRCGWPAAACAAGRRSARRMKSGCTRSRTGCMCMICTRRSCGSWGSGTWTSFTNTRAAPSARR